MYYVVVLRSLVFILFLVSRSLFLFNLEFCFALDVYLFLLVFPFVSFGVGDFF